MISGSREYKPEPSLKAWKKHLEATYRVSCTLTLARDKGKELPGIGALEKADLLVVFCRRISAPDEQTRKVKTWCKAGKPVIGLRTASHAFQNWLAFDKEVLGGSYKGHGGPEQRILAQINDTVKDHPVLAGLKSWTRPGKLYRNPNLQPDTMLLITGIGQKDKQPIAWSNAYNGGRAFYTSMGFPHDFENENFRRLMLNAIEWATQKKIIKR
jgi:type 1 glutamine amidotransferase